ncbi:hypothetical protein BJX66DRAFT_344041 [Aspergillus keveii]|uniref:Uncharacterized protein n=1 Tax=Aspergillus keveii TaxID=714993 RepID=A0ABR4FMF5_9EURO
MIDDREVKLKVDQRVRFLIDGAHVCRMVSRGMCGPSIRACFPGSRPLIRQEAKSFGLSEKLTYGPRREIATVERKLLEGSTGSVTGAELAKGISGCTDKSQPFESAEMKQATKLRRHILHTRSIILRRVVKMDGEDPEGIAHSRPLHSLREALDLLLMKNDDSAVEEWNRNGVQARGHG